MTLRPEVLPAQPSHLRTYLAITFVGLVLGFGLCDTAIDLARDARITAHARAISR